MTVRRAATFAIAVLLGTGAARAAPPGSPTKRCTTAAESGQQLRQQGRLVAAKRTLLACTAVECPQVIRRDCARWVEELEAGTPTIVLKLEDESGHDVASGRVLVDGEEIEKAGAGRAVPIDPGTHRIAWMRPEGDFDIEIVVHEDEKNRPVVLRPPGKQRAPDAAVSPVPPPPGQGARSTTTPTIIGVAGGLAIAAGATLWGIGLTERSDLESGCGKSRTCSDAAISTSRSKLVVGDVLVGVGILAVVTSAWILLRGDGTTPAARF